MHAFPRSSILIIEDNLAISSLIPSTLVDQVDALLDAHRIDDAAALVDQRRKKLEGNLTVDPDEAGELDYAYQVIGFQCFSETLFEDAGRNLFNGKLDPRILVSYFPDLRGGLFKGAEEVVIFSGVAERMPTASSIEELIHLNLVLNYSPHLSPTSPPTLELTRVLNDAAREMLLVFLEKSRKRAKVERRSEDSTVEVVQVVDTVLAKLYVHFSRHSALLNLLSPSSDPPLIVLEELEPILLLNSLLSPLSRLYKQYQQYEKLLDLYASITDKSSSLVSSSTDPGLSDPVNGVFDLLTSPGLKHDRKMCIKWGLWMLKQGEVDRGLQLLVPPEPPKRRERDKDKEKEVEIELLEQIQSTNETAGRRYLEYLVLVKRHTSPRLHTRLALACIDDLTRCLQDDSVLKLWRAKASSYSSPRPSTYSHSHNAASPLPQSLSSPSLPYASPSSPLPPAHAHSPSSHPQPSSSHSQTHLPSPPPVLHKSSLYTNHQPQQPQQPFLTYFASTTPDSPSKRTRLKAVFMLAGSGLYNAARALDRLLCRGADEGESRMKGSSGKGVDVESILALECAILYGKLGNHSKALGSLVHTLRDDSSAEAYCILGGEVVSAKSALAVAESTAYASQKSAPTTTKAIVELGPRGWYLGLFEPQSVSGKAAKRGVINGGVRGVGEDGVVPMDAPAVVRQNSVKEEVKKALLTDLVGVYVRSGDTASGMERTTKLLNSQGVNLDIADVVKLIPDDWPLKSTSTYLERHFRRSLHARHEFSFLKNLCVGQNLLVQEQAWPILREHGYVIEEPDSDAEGQEVFDEKAEAVEKLVPIISEKASYQDSAPEQELFIEVHVGGNEVVGERDAEVEGREEGDVMSEGRGALGLILDGGPDDSARRVGDHETDVGSEGTDVTAEQSVQEEGALGEGTPEEGDGFVYKTGTKDGVSEEDHEDDEDKDFVYEDGKDNVGREQRREEEEESEGGDFVYEGRDAGREWRSGGDQEEISHR